MTDKKESKTQPITTPRDHFRNVGFGPAPELNKTVNSAPETAHIKAKKEVLARTR